jgi:diguanylate cyclase (GGDEF)-like protein
VRHKDGTRSPSKGIIAVLTDEYCDYRQVIVDHIAQRVAAEGYGLLCVVGRELQSLTQGDGAACNAIYPLVDRYPVCGVISMSGAIGHSVSAAQLDTFLSQFSLPLVSLGIVLDNHPSVGVNDLHGMEQLMEHLLADASRQKIAFVRGYANDPYSAEREQVFRRKLLEHGLRPDERFFVAGNYDAFESWQVVSALLQDHPDIDAIVAANDAMALSVAHAVNESGRRIPKDIAVTGFDDTLEATKNSPAITTVRQPLRELAVGSVEMLLDQMASADDIAAATPVRWVDSELIIRGSTSVVARDGVAARLPDRLVLRQQIDTALAGLRPPDGIVLDTVHEALWDTLQSGSDTLADCFARLLATPLQVESTHWWSNLCHQIESHGVALLQANGRHERIPLLRTAIAMVQERIWSVNMDHEFRLRRMQSTLSTLQLQMSSCSNAGDILDATERWLQTIGARRCFMVRFSEPASQADERAELVYRYRQGEGGEALADEFDSADLLPAPYRAELESAALILQPIYSDHDLYGYLLIDPAGLEALHLDSTAHSIGNAMRSRFLMDRLEQQAVSLQRANRELAQLANHDALTGLPNRLQFQQRLNQRCERAADTGERFALLFIDLDGFKQVNDTLGHDAGDLLLQAVAKRLQRAMQACSIEDSTITRLGGDEFTVILGPVEQQALLEQIIDNILQSLCATFTLGQQPANISASIGCAVYPDNSQRADVLVKQADTAMYHAKEQGKNRRSFFGTNLNRSGDQRFELAQDIREALQRHAFSLHYQPRVDLQTGEIVALEALMRWFTESPQGLQLRAQTDDFIRAAAQSGLILQLDSFALDEACQQARAWELAGTPVRVAVNISAAMVQQENFIARVSAAVRRHALTPTLLELEVTESAIVSDIDASIKKVDLLRKLGIRVSVDNFGTGYSSLNSLKTLAIDQLKIDRSFVAELAEVNGVEYGDARVVRAIVALADSLDLGVIAVGVETEAQKQSLLSLGCGQAQGFLLSEAVPPEKISEILHNGSFRRVA